MNLNPRGEKERFLQDSLGRSRKCNREEDFWQRAYIPDNPNGCWMWKGLKQTRGYGVFNYRGQQELAHRMAYRFAYGPIPTEMFVLHLCGKKPCINPKHLYLGTAKDNAQDAIRFGEVLPGEGHSNSKLTEIQVCQIRKMKVTGYTEIQIAPLFGVSRSLIGLIHRRKLWKHLN